MQAFERENTSMVLPSIRTCIMHYLPRQAISGVQSYFLIGDEAWPSSKDFISGTVILTRFIFNVKNIYWNSYDWLFYPVSKFLVLSNISLSCAVYFSLSSNSSPISLIKTTLACAYDLRREFPFNISGEKHDRWLND